MRIIDCRLINHEYDNMAVVPLDRKSTPLDGAITCEGLKCTIQHLREETNSSRQHCHVNNHLDKTPSRST